MKNIIIIGGGASGILAMNQIVNTSNEHSDVMISMIEKEKIFGGLAYNLAALPGTVLNTQIRTMSAFDDDANHLFEWINSPQTDKSNWPIQYKQKLWDEREFCPRILYGFYLRDILETTKTLAKEKNIQIAMYEDYALGIQVINKHNVVVTLNSGKHLNGQSIIMCIGQLGAAQLPVYQKIANDSKFIKELWSNEGINQFKKVSVDEDVLIIGTGLTSNDIIAARKEMIDHLSPEFPIKKIGQTYMVSRHGCMHVPFPMNYSGWSAHDIKIELPKTFNDVHDLKMFVKNRALELLKEGIHPEEIYRNIMRKLVPLWQSLPIDQRLILFKKYKHLDVYRTGISKLVMDCVTDMQARHALTIYAGDILSIEKAADGFNVKLLIKCKDNTDGHKYKEEKVIHVNTIINAAGFENLLASSATPLVQSLLSQELANKNYLGLGLDVSAAGQLYSKDRSLLPIFCIGALGNGYTFDHFGKLGSARSMAGIRKQIPTTINKVISFQDDTNPAFEKYNEALPETNHSPFRIFSPSTKAPSSTPLPSKLKARL